MSAVHARTTGYALLFLFALSGFAGLVYQSVWSHYLGLTLGHAAYAQTLVLAIFMGGMALGAWLASHSSMRWSRLILVYAVIEAAIGIAGMVFHPLFVAYTGFSQGTVLPAISSVPLAHFYQWLSAAMLIAPQSILLGMTFPLMSAGYLRIAAGQDGEVLGGLYFTNSIGAAAGALVTTFVLLPAVGMPGSMLTAGLLNLLVALGAWAVSNALQDQPLRQPGAAAPPIRAAARDRLAPVLYVAAFITGATSFAYEIGWVRLLNQALGTTIHAFELMLAAFIFGLACGGLWIRGRAARIRDAVRYAAFAQILMGIAALLSLLVFAQSFRWVSWMLGAFTRSDSGYTLFSVGSATISLLVMFPAAFFAGMTLPLFTVALLRRGGAENVIGRVYAANTLGAIVGVFATVHVLIPAVNVHGAIIVGAALDALLGLALLWFYCSPRQTAWAVAATSVCALVMALALSGGKPDSRAQASGVFRTGRARVAEGTKVDFIKDGKTATISVFTYADDVRVISTNGKPDAGLAKQITAAPSPDEITMIMASALPLALHPNPRRIAIIGWGSGLSTHTMLGSPFPEVVDSVEIERQMYEGAREFGARVERAYSDPRSHPHFEDARTYFSTGNRKYDVIISEPSNPWVSGVASLFTLEFYRFLKSHLKRDGMLVQWLQAYELRDDLLATMIAALLSQFPETELYITNTGDLLLVARTGSPGFADWSRLHPKGSELAAELRRVGFDSAGEAAVRRVGGPRVLRAFARITGVRAHSDFFPTVSLEAPQSRFIGSGATMLQNLVENGLPVLDLLDGRQPPRARDHVADTKTSRLVQAHRLALDVRASMLQRRPTAELIARSPAHAALISTLLSMSSGPMTEQELSVWSAQVAELARVTLGALAAEDLAGVWIGAEWLHPAARSHQTMAILGTLEAAARRNPVEMLHRAEVALSLPADNISTQLREQMLVIAMLGAAADGQDARVREIDHNIGANVPSSPALGPIRAFILAWIDDPARSGRQARAATPATAP